MRLLLIGCTGFIGRELVPQLLKAGHEITMISRKPPKNFHQKIGLNSCDYIQTDPSIPSNWTNQKLKEAIERSDGIINLAGEPIADKRWTNNHCQKIQSSRISTTECLTRILQEIRKPPKVLINASAIGFYGSSEKGRFNEKSNKGKDFLSDVCDEWEKVAQKKPRATRLIILRIGIVIGPDGGALGKMLPVFRAGLGGPIGNGKQWMSWIHRTDICNIIENCISNKNWSGIINCVSPEPTSMASFSLELGKILKRPTLLTVPGPLLKLLLGDGAKIVLEGQHVSSIYLNKFGYKFIYPNLNMALSAATK